MTRQFLGVAALVGLVTIAGTQGVNADGTAAPTLRPAADMTVVTPPEELTEAVRAVFPESYSQFMTVRYERQDAGTGRKPEIWPKDTSFLVPAAAYAASIEDELAARVADLITRVLRPGDAHCESVDVADPEDYGWMAWPDKRVRKIAVTFNVAC